MGRLNIAQFEVAESPAILSTSSLGSCVGIALYDPKKKIGGMAHALLPDSTKSKRKSEGQVGKFVDTCVAELIRQMLVKGARREHIWAKIFGGAELFSEIDYERRESIGKRNVNAAFDVLESEQIEIVAQDTGGAAGRSLFFELETGCVKVVKSGSERNF